MRTAIMSFVMLGSFLRLPLAHAQKVSPPNVPDAIQARPGEEVVLLAHASGSQIYSCLPGTAKFVWTLIAPEAELKDQQDNVIGSHFGGPTWKLQDGSAVKGRSPPTWTPRIPTPFHGCGWMSRATPALAGSRK